ncbi:LPXTG-motif cell wall-anchored protein [Cryobacterium mesophilum]|uniref:LPXTG cell wall anchor domain-containing protein n=1 Tax=Terrimesophilobacter mesophilus TaxID=433647 RepID=A0A4R8VA70_9MICO|nr:LPXTG cell wall anchor domain-containing protein [Terrimesophilobacter mesophilus]MBB5632107.1 LPXTG-motif cell wall-anchored protein [Terrimesophilobacter mesophilus]TFB78980.1 LPXTG cell wall anchor domain-containing protein [Terrimesophilobacter mesophilus]
MSRHLSLRPLLAVVATAGLLALSAAPAYAVDPGDGAVIFNPDGTPIGSELMYDGGTTPQYVYTNETEDDDYWGLDGTGVPADDDGNFGAANAGIPLGFSVTVAGVSYDEVLVGSNGDVCLASSTDVTSNGSFNQCSDFYGELIGSIFDPNYGSEPHSYAAFLPFNLDQYPPAADTPLDTNADTIPDTCEYGAYLFEFESNYYCSSVFWGTTTYEGKNAFVATWYHNPDINLDPDAEFNTFQVLLVDNGGGNVTVVYNYDEVHNSGMDLSWPSATSSIPTEAACAAVYGDGDDLTEYYMIGMGGYNLTADTYSYLDLFGPTCGNGTYPHTADELRDGGSYALSSHNLNSTVPGRYVFRVVNGLPTLTMPAVTPPKPELAATGATTSGAWMAGAGALMLGGILFVASRRRRSRLA